MLTQTYGDITSAGNPAVAYIYTTSVDNNSTDAGEQEVIPRQFALYQNYPNPFNPTTRITFSLPSFGSNHAKGRDGVGLVSLKIYDLLGREVATLVNERLSPGTYAREWNATGMPSGVYFYRLSTPNFVQTRKLVLLR